jgi:pimeloyl-ACP methyl ester carboxylesterase
MGSLIALESAARAQHRVSHLVMIGTSVPMPVPQALLDLALNDVHAAIDRVVSFSFSTLAAKPSFPGPGTWLRGCARGMMRQVVARGEPHLFHTEFTACNAYQGGLAAAERVTAPSLFILGQADQMTQPRGAAEIAQRLRATVHAVPSGHYPMQECPDPVLNVLRQSLR